MEDISISQFKKYVQTFINAAKIDDGNGVIETENGELSKLLSNFGLEESQIGDLLIKSDNSANRTKNTNSAEQPSSKDIHKAFIEAYKKYDEMTTEQKKNVRTQTVEKEVANYEAMRDALYKLSLEPLYSSLTDLFNDNTIDEKKLLKVIVTQQVLTLAQRQQEKMQKMIETYDDAFSKYDVTYRSPFEVEQSIMVSPDNSIPEKFMSLVMSEIRNYLSEDTTSQTIESTQNLLTSIDSLIQEYTNEIKTTGDNIAENYKNDHEASIIELNSDNPQVVPWNPPIDGQPHEEEPEYIAIKGAPVKKTFTDVIYEVDKSVSSIETISSTGINNNQTIIYDLSGKPVTRGLQKGRTYIQNGKKFIAQ